MTDDSAPVEINVYPRQPDSRLGEYITVLADGPKGEIAIGGFLAPGQSVDDWMWKTFKLFDLGIWFDGDGWRRPLTEADVV